MRDHLESVFPGLKDSQYEETSPADSGYNCLAWAAQDARRWWWPGVGRHGFWPAGAPAESTLEAAVVAYGSIGFVPCDGEEEEPGWEKIAIFADGQGELTHAARQLEGGRWTSKLGKAIDIEHDLRALEGAIYGTVSRFMKRKR